MMASGRPSVILLGGPNGAGKSTAAPALLRGSLGVTEFVNADLLASGLSGFDPDRMAMTAGRIMIQRLRELAECHRSFAFETTLASRSFAPWGARLIQSGYVFRLVYLWLPSADVAVARVAERARMGGHHVPEETVRRRYNGGLWNFFRLYRPLTATWRMYDNTGVSAPRLIASGNGVATTRVRDTATWDAIRSRYEP